MRKQNMVKTKYAVKFATSEDGVRPSHISITAAVRHCMQCRRLAARQGDTQGIRIVAIEGGVMRALTPDESFEATLQGYY